MLHGISFFPLPNLNGPVTLVDLNHSQVQLGLYEYLLIREGTFVPALAVVGTPGGTADPSPLVHNRPRFPIRIAIRHHLVQDTGKVPEPKLLLPGVRGYLASQLKDQTL